MNFNTSFDKGHFKCVNGPSGLWLLEQHYLKSKTKLFGDMDHQEGFLLIEVAHIG